eukprot:403342354
MIKSSRKQSSQSLSTTIIENPSQSFILLAGELDTELTKILKHYKQMEQEESIKIDKNDLKVFIKHFEKQIKTQKIDARNQTKYVRQCQSYKNLNQRS